MSSHQGISRCENGKAVLLTKCSGNFSWLILLPCHASQEERPVAPRNLLQAHTNLLLAWALPFSHRGEYQTSKRNYESTKARVKSGNDRFSLISVNLSHPFSSKDEEEQWQLTKLVSLCNLGVLSKSPLIYSPNLRPTNSPAAFPVLWVFLVIRPSRWEGLNHFRVTWVSCYWRRKRYSSFLFPLLSFFHFTQPQIGVARVSILSLYLSFIDRCSLGTPQPFNGWSSTSCLIMLVAVSFQHSTFRVGSHLISR